MTVKIFISYSHRDERYKEKLDTFCKNLFGDPDVDVWHDRHLSPGDNFDKKIMHKLAEADIIILLISSHFLASDYCYGKEMKEALSKQKRNQGIAFAVILEDCDWQSTALSDFIVLPKDGKPLKRFHSSKHPEVYNNITQRLRKCVADVQKNKKQQAAPSPDSVRKTIKKPEKRTVKINLPDDVPVHFTPEFLQPLGDIIYKVYSFTDYVDNYLFDLAEYRGQLTDYQVLQGFLTQMCRAVNNAFFEYDGTRTHFRCLNIKSRKYEKLAAAYAKDEYLDTMQAIGWNKSMISRSTQLKRSLIYSINKQYHSGRALDRFEDYITFSITDSEFIVETHHALLCMGISVENATQYKYILYLLNYCKFETIITEILKKFQRKMDIQISATLLGHHKK